MNNRVAKKLRQIALKLVLAKQKEGKNLSYKRLLRHLKRMYNKGKLKL